MKEAANGVIIRSLVQEYSSPFDFNKKVTAIILAAGHGKRIKSQTSKMLHMIWEVPTVERVCNACEKGLSGSNVIIVVGIKADDVIKTVGKRKDVSFAYQEFQNGTGHAVQIALKNIADKNYDGTVFIFPGDMGLIDAETIKLFKDEFEKSNADMMVLTGIYEGEIENNYYGRIIRVPSVPTSRKNKDGENSKQKDPGKVIQILEYKDILNLDKKRPFILKYHNKNYKFTQSELLKNREFNSGVYAFKFKLLAELIHKIENNNIQNEIYLTDLISLFNQHGYTVEAVVPKEQYVLMGFNNKSVLKEMDAIARKLAYEKLKDVITIDNPDDFFIEENVIEEILKLDKQESALEIHIGKGVYIGKGVKLNYNLTFLKNVFLNGDIRFGKNITVKENAQLSAFYGQRIEIGDNVEIFWGDIIKGNVSVGKNSKIESGVRITGSDQYPAKIGSNVTIKGLTYIFGSHIEDTISIEHSILIRKKISKPEGLKAEHFHVRFYLPEAEGKEAVKDL